MAAAFLEEAFGIAVRSADVTGNGSSANDGLISIGMKEPNQLPGLKGSNSSSRVLIPETTTFLITWWLYFLFLAVFTIYCAFVGIQLFRVIYAHQRSLVGSVTGLLTSLIAVSFLLVIAVVIRWITLFACNYLLILVVLVFDVGILVIEFLAFTIKNCCCIPESICNVLCLMTSDVVEVILLAILFSELKSFCDGLPSKAGSVCEFSISAGQRMFNASAT